MAEPAGSNDVEQAASADTGLGLRTMKVFTALVLLAGLAHLPAGGYLHEYNGPAQIAYDVPKDWAVDNEKALFEAGFIVPPEPLYALVASPTPTPASVALNASAVPWVFVTVETDKDLLPASELYELAPEYLQSLAKESGNPATAVKALAPHRPVRQGGLNGSAAAIMVVSAAGSTSFDEVAYEKGDQIWMVIAGCSATCYGQDYTSITHVVNSVKVGTAA